MSYLAPTFALEIGGTLLSASVTQFVQSVEYESADGIADVATVKLLNPDLIFTDSKLFMPGNTMDIWMGYGGGERLSHIGRVVITRPEPTFPADEIPTLTVKGYTLDYEMMDREPVDPKARRFRSMRYSDIVAAKAEAYGMEADIDPTEGVKNIYQKVGMKDYDLVRGLANLTGYVFWVDFDVKKDRWVLHFKRPDAPVDQDRKYTFRYNDGERSTLFNFDAEVAVSNARTELKVEVFDPRTGRTYTETIIDDARRPDLLFTGDPKATTQLPETSGAVKLYFGEYSFEVVTDKRFETTAELKTWAATWFRRNRDNFIVGRGEVIGIESLRARQVHTLEGLGRSYSGDYQFARVRHIMTNDGGYKCEFHGRKVVKSRGES